MYTAPKIKKSIAVLGACLIFVLKYSILRHFQGGIYNILLHFFQYLGASNTLTHQPSKNSNTLKHPKIS